MPFQQLVFELARDELSAAEAACTALGALAISVADAGGEALLEPPPGTTPLWRNLRVSALFPMDTDARLAGATLAAVLGLAPGAIAAEQVADRIWEREWLRDFRPMRFGRRLWVSPVGERPASSGGVVLELDPGLAFGTGTHPTTALCLEWLDAHVKPGQRVLDYGCGSGILALAALALGAASAVAWDIDPQARLACAQNAMKGGFADRVSVASGPGAIGGRFDVVLANILAEPLKRLAEPLARCCVPGGALVLAGMLEPQASEVAASYRPWFDISVPAERDGWSLLHGRRRAE